MRTFDEFVLFVLMELLFEVHRGLIIQSAVEPFWIIKSFDVIKDHGSGLLVVVREAVAKAFRFECGKERFGQSVVITVAFAAHAGAGT